MAKSSEKMAAPRKVFFGTEEESPKNRAETVVALNSGQTVKSREERKVMSIRLPVDLFDSLTEEAHEKNLTRAGLVKAILTQRYRTRKRLGLEAAADPEMFDVPGKS